MIEWWGFFVYCCFLGTILGATTDHPAGWIFGLLIGFIIGTLPPTGPSLSFDPNDL